MRKPHRKQRLAWLLTAALLLTNLPVSVLSEEVVENPIQTEIVEQDEPETVEEPNETPESGEPSGTMEIPADENTPDIPDQDICPPKFILKRKKKSSNPIRTQTDTSAKR